MSQQEPVGPYVYQPRANLAPYNGRLWGVGGLPIGTICEGFTREEAAVIVTALKSRVAAPTPETPSQPTDAPPDKAGRLMLNAYGRQCWDAGFEAGKLAGAVSHPQPEVRPAICDPEHYPEDAIPEWRCPWHDTVAVTLEDGRRVCILCEWDRKLAHPVVSPRTET